MYSSKLEIVVQLDDNDYYKVYLNGICASKWKVKSNAEQYVKDVLELNKDKKVIASFISQFEDET